MKAIFKREFLAYFQTLTGYLAVDSLLLILFLYFIFSNVLGFESEISLAAEAVGVFGVTFAVPLLCMRVFAQERRQRTDQLYLTAPVSVEAVVFGKFLALAAVFAIPCLAACLLPLVMSFFGSVQYLYCYTAICGLFLYGLAAIAVCMLISCLSENPMSAAVCAMLVLLTGMVAGNAYAGIPSAGLRAVCTAVFDLNGRLRAILDGTFDCRAAVYFVSVALLFLYLCVYSIKCRRRAASGAAAYLRTFGTAAAAVLAAAVLNFAVSRLPERYLLLDVTAVRYHSVTEASAAVAREVKSPVTLYYLAGEGRDAADKNTVIEHVLQTYADMNDQITLVHIDPEVNPQFGSRYGEASLHANSVVVVNEDDDRFRVIRMEDMIVTGYRDLTPHVVAYDIEGEVTAALQYVTLPENALRRVLLTTGHNEAAVQEEYRDLLRRYNLQPEEWNPKTAAAVPEECALLVINAPTIDFTADETERVLDYLRSGGNLLALTSIAAEKEMPNFDRLCAWYGIANEYGVVIETDPDRYYYSPTSAAPFFLFPVPGDDAILSGLAGSAGQLIFMPYARAFILTDTPGVVQTPLLLTSAQAYLKRDLESASLARTPEDPSGQFVLGAKAVRSDAAESTAVFYASADLFTEESDQMVSGQNARLFANTLKALTPEAADIAAVPMKYVGGRLTITSGNQALLTVLCIAVVVCVALCGVLVRLQRRRR